MSKRGQYYKGLRYLVAKSVALKLLSTISGDVMVEFGEKLFVSSYGYYDEFLPNNAKSRFLFDIKSEDYDGVRIIYKDYEQLLVGYYSQIMNDIEELGEDFYLGNDEVNYVTSLRKEYYQKINETLKLV